ncbi:hypothetical protein SNEBB_010528, partial [Seison nebaliae]
MPKKYNKITHGEDMRKYMAHLRERLKLEKQRELEEKDRMMLLNVMEQYVEENSVLQIPTESDENSVVFELNDHGSVPISTDTTTTATMELNDHSSHYLMLEQRHIDYDNHSSSEDEDEKDDSFPEELRALVLNYQLNSNFLTAVLKLVKRYYCPRLPSTARTFLQTPRKVKVANLSDMEYIYFGLEQQIILVLKRFSNIGKLNVNFLQITVNVDGLSIHKSNNTSLWPILCSIDNLLPVVVFPVAACYGVSKPTNLDFMHDFINELKRLMEVGIKYSISDNTPHKTLRLMLNCIVCDAPAKAMIKNIKYCTGYYGCDRCNQMGTYTISKVTFPEMTDLHLRTDESFRRNSNTEHHK